MTVKDIRPALRAFLLADSVISTAVGGARVYPTKMAQGVTAESLVYNLISEVGDVHTEGPDGLCSARIQVDAYATTADAAMALALQVKDRLFGYRGTMGSGGNAVTVQGVFLGGTGRTEFDDIAQMHRVSRDFLVGFEDRG
ncbi:hypothetical protein ASD45_08535 [Pseudolabrys sp. Root1462]|uniref:tail completion protein gp17 n=1 Tax=Pseudolabrys sp. Root1462 TaxID=1736466 RepID=UPI0007030AF8|nr:DUF3168 domain-containing protein [Pseudolabrys sp. Root1462]KQZ00900.1 hypothetical protein ASD45_08535 [Pseudolabrys sp. Root1462]